MYFVGAEFWNVVMWNCEVFGHHTYIYVYISFYSIYNYSHLCIQVYYLLLDVHTIQS